MTRQSIGPKTWLYSKAYMDCFDAKASRKDGVTKFCTLQRALGYFFPSLSSAALSSGWEVHWAVAWSRDFVSSLNVKELVGVSGVNLARDGLTLHLSVSNLASGGCCLRWVII